jgi:hypothetical protein
LLHPLLTLPVLHRATVQPVLKHVLTPHPALLTVLLLLLLAVLVPAPA